LQVVAAYGALANGGKLMEPYLVREIRGADDRIFARRSPGLLREVVPEDVARAVTDVLVAVVEEGTATRAGLSTFAVAGKTGTTRRMSGGGYAPGSYTSTFVGYFPAHDPQIVIFVKLDEPQGAYYGGLTAAPVTRETLQGILAARAPGIDSRSLLRARTVPASLAITAETRSGVPQIGPEGTYVFLLNDGVPEPAGTGAELVTVPTLTGMSLREAARRAHAAGLRVQVSGSGTVVATQPRAGTQLGRGGKVTLLGGPG
ncbi:MAG TPA: penicillin-binding transpeptidase domain-containing protein, partial [Longimicrobiaceae bacterium]|nr:penicillin-binding transpeptidase domain-containing protein [Longimicrobiaceae bacterium]